MILKSLVFGSVSCRLSLNDILFFSLGAGVSIGLLIELLLFKSGDCSLTRDVVDSFIDGLLTPLFLNNAFSKDNNLALKN